MATGKGNVFKNAEEGAKLVTATSKFALSLYKEQAAAGTGNVFMSPMSISIAMAMTYLGARGETMSQMKAGMFFSDVNEADLHQAFSDVRKALNSSDDKYKLLLANRLFGEKSYSFEADYLASSEKFYGAQLAPVDFIHNPAVQVGLVNKWVAQNTNEKIKDILSPADVTSVTRLILVNAIYFKGAWKNQFSSESTTEQDFHVSASETIKVQLMFLRETKVAYGENKKINCKAIELPYEKNALSMFVILPDHTVTDIHTVERSLEPEDLVSITDSFKMRRSEVNVWLPRFKVEDKLQLNGLLSKLGIVDLFLEGKADLSGINKAKEFYVSKVIHQSFVEVNEQGSEAAAATAVVMHIESCCMNPDPILDFRADHPFIFFIRDNATQSILFLGRLIKT